MSDKRILQKMKRCILKRIYTVFAGSIPFLLIELLLYRPIVYFVLFLFFFGSASIAFLSSVRDDRIIKRLLKKRKDNREGVQYTYKNPELLYLPRHTEQELAVKKFKGAS